jgi:hypothetical protein
VSNQEKKGPRFIAFRHTSVPGNDSDINSFWEVKSFKIAQNLVHNHINGNSDLVSAQIYKIEDGVVYEIAGYEKFYDENGAVQYDREKPEWQIATKRNPDTHQFEKITVKKMEGWIEGTN